MFDKLKKQSVKKSLLSVILLVVIGIVLMATEFSNLKSVLNGHVKFETLAPDEINGDLIVDATLTANFGAFMEEYEENTKTHATRTTSLYYVIWTGDDYAVDYRYMAIKVPVASERAMETMAEETYNYGYANPIECSGAINKMSKEEYQYFKEYFAEAGFTEEEIEAQTLPYYIDEGALIGGAASSVYVLFGIGAVLVIIGVLRLVLAIGGSRLKTFKKEMEAAGLGENEVEYDYECARVLDEKSDIRIGRKLIFFMIGSKPHAVPNQKLVWAYQRTVTHRTNGIKTGTTYEVVLKTYEKKTFYISVKNENMALNILQYMGEQMPWVVLGYNDELEKLFNRDYQNFLQLRYNSERQI